MKPWVTFIIGLLLGFVAAWLLMPKAKAPTEHVVELRDTLRDTLRVVEPRELVRYVMRRDTAWLPGADIHDTVRVVVPIERKEWTDSTYRIVGHGYRMGLDTVEVYPTTVTVREIRTAQAAPSRWGIGLTAGVGYTPVGIQPYIGVGVTFRLTEIKH